MKDGGKEKKKRANVEEKRKKKRKEAKGLRNGLRGSTRY